MDLHYSQTTRVSWFGYWQFESPMDLHYSQTTNANREITLKFESPMDLHYSQTQDGFNDGIKGLNPLWIYTTLKPLE